MKTLLIAAVLSLTAACGCPVEEVAPPLPDAGAPVVHTAGEYCTHRETSHTYCNSDKQQIVCETTADPAINLWFFNGDCTGREGAYCQAHPEFVSCDDVP